MGTLEAPTRTITDLNYPCGVAVDKRGQIIIAESDMGSASPSTVVERGLGHSDRKAVSSFVHVVLQWTEQATYWLWRMATTRSLQEMGSLFQLGWKQW